MIKDRIVQVLEFKRIPKENFYTKIGMTSANFRGDAKKTPLNSTAIENILSEIIDLNAEWLLTGNGEMLKQSSIATLTKNVDGIPLVSPEVAGGFGNVNFLISDKDIEARYVVPDFNGIDFMIRVKGSSMYPKYSSGDIIACRKLTSCNFIQWNKCHVIATAEQGLLVKRLKKGSTEKCILAVSDNKEYDPFEIPLDEVSGIALVIGVIRLE